MNILIVSFLKIKMKGLVFVNEVGIYLSLDLRMVYVSQLYVVKMFLNEFLGYEIQYVFNVTGNYFLDLDTFNKLGYKTKINTHTTSCINLFLDIYLYSEYRLIYC